MLHIDSDHSHRLSVASRLASLLRSRLDDIGLGEVSVHFDEASGFYGDSIELRFRHATRNIPVLLSVESTGGSVVAPPYVDGIPVSGPYRSPRQLGELVAEAIGCIGGFAKGGSVLLQ